MIASRKGRYRDSKVRSGNNGMNNGKSSNLRRGSRYNVLEDHEDLIDKDDDPNVESQLRNMDCDLPLYIPKSPRQNGKQPYEPDYGNMIQTKQTRKPPVKQPKPIVKATTSAQPESSKAQAHPSTTSHATQKNNATQNKQNNVTVTSIHTSLDPDKHTTIIITESQPSFNPKTDPMIHPSPSSSERIIGDGCHTSDPPNMDMDIGQEGSEERENQDDDSSDDELESSDDDGVGYAEDEMEVYTNIDA